MPRKNSNIKFLTNTLNSPKSTPEKIKNAFFKYIEHTKNFYGRQLYQNKISNAEYSDNIELIDALSDRINLIVISYLAEIYRNNEVQYESTINNLCHTLCKIIEDIILRCQEYNIDFNIVNSILEKNGIETISLSRTRKCYSSFKDAIEATNNSERFVKINQDGEEIKESYSLSRFYFFIQEEINECSNSSNIQKEISKCSNSNNIEVEIDDGKYFNNENNDDVDIFDTDIFDTDMFEF
ncbi:11880_t:CDS:2 [Racocetra persica]|uniref:11880_t:CDS:1 n=1 Tax=Racocetra persica TaxID=160502 RepID=A0ACA9KU10_9GLOM|nr:11880_t:CDS:2 [Racocetra persica]